MKSFLEYKNVIKATFNLCYKSLTPKTKLKMKLFMQFVGL